MVYQHSHQLHLSPTSTPVLLLRANLCPPLDLSGLKRLHRPNQIERRGSRAKNNDTTVIMAERYIPEHRRTQFKAKNTFKPDELRRRREEQQVEIRKAKREENLAKRRGITARDGTQTSAPGASLGAAPDSDDEGGTIESQVR